MGIIVCNLQDLMQHSLKTASLASRYLEYLVTYWSIRWRNFDNNVWWFFSRCGFSSWHPRQEGAFGPGGDRKVSVTPILDPTSLSQEPSPNLLPWSAGSCPLPQICLPTGHLGGSVGWESDLSLCLGLGVLELSHVWGLCTLQGSTCPSPSAPPVPHMCMLSFSLSLK